MLTKKNKTFMSRINQKDIKILKLHEKGIREAVIAQKMGYCGKNLFTGIQLVREALERMGIKN